jgi:YVTN family beta-propeller protein
VALLPSQGEVLAANSGDGTVSVIDGSTNAVVRTLGVGPTPDAVAVTPDQSTAVVTNEGDNTISILRGPVVGSVNFTGAVENTAFGVGTSPARPSTSTSGTVLSNSSDPNGGTLTAHPGTIATAHGGSVAMNADGTFTYHPGAGFTGVDSFPFTVSNGIANASGTAQTPSRTSCGTSTTPAPRTAPGPRPHRSTRCRT